MEVILLVQCQGAGYAIHVIDTSDGTYHVAWKGNTKQEALAMLVGALSTSAHLFGASITLTPIRED